MEKIRLLIADDHTNVRSSLVARLGREAGIEIVGQASTSNQAVEYALARKPHVVLIDPMMKDGQGLEALRQISGYLPGTKVVVLTAFVDTSMHLEFRKIGVPEILVKGVDTSRLVEVLRGVIETNHLG